MSLVLGATTRSPPLAISFNQLWTLQMVSLLYRLRQTLFKDPDEEIVHIDQACSFDMSYQQQKDSNG